MESKSADGDQFSSRTAGGTELSWCRAVPGGTGITVLALQLARHIPLPLIRSYFSRLQRSSPILRAILPSGASAANIIIPPYSSLEIEVISSDRLPHVADAAIFHSVIELEMNRNPWMESVGSLFVTIYELIQPDHSILAIRLHTGVCDRTAGLAILKGLIDTITGEENKNGDEEKEGNVNLAIEDLIRKEDSRKPFWARGKDLIGYSLNGFWSASLPFEDTSSNRRSEIAMLVMNTEATRRLLKACDANGVKLCAALAAATMAATYESNKLKNNQKETYSVVTLIDCRQYLIPPLSDEHIGFYHSAILNTHTIHKSELFWQIARKWHKTYLDAKNNKKHLSDIGDLNFLMGKAIENPRLTPASSMRTALVSIFEDVADCDAVLGQLRGVGIEDYFECASVHGIGASIALFPAVKEGQLHCVCVYPSPLHSREQMLGLVNDMKRTLIQASFISEGGN